ncbi:14136_t:CDS:2 [Funneliformis caledonium]|uniref:14136_t:CDS:1 n=2 Tax=Funneliformis TaxID=1117308 RepID=A0A9N8ZPY6_9GLOM|nr:14136_t:CDS:2 [Funneliformis caledonium]
MPTNGAADDISNHNDTDNNAENLASRDKITLNVGGIKYETYRSTLTSYPTTLLGSIFYHYSDEENPLTDPNHGNEFFIDRDGHLFHYIMQFYRTGKVPTTEQAIGLVPITAQELEDELEYFKIPTYPPSSFSATTLSPSQLSLRHKMIAAEIDSFTSTLNDTLLTISSQFKKEFFFKRQFQIRFEITFHHNERISDFNIYPSVNSIIKTRLQKGFDEFALLGYAMLDRFGEEIGRYMTTTVQGCTWECKKVEEFGWGGLQQMYKVKVGVENSFEHDDVVNHCCLSSVVSDSMGASSDSMS